MAAKKIAKPTAKLSPISGKPMSLISLFNNRLAIETCAESDGYWLDSGEAKQLYHFAREEGISAEDYFSR